MEEYQIEKDDIIESDSESGESSGSSEIDEYEFHYNSEDDMISDTSSDESDVDKDDMEIDNSDNGNKELKKKEKKNIFFLAISPKIRKTRKDKLNLDVVRDFCHDICRLDTFATAKIFVHNYDGSRSYHQVHVKSQSLKDYYKAFQNTSEYYNWQNENMRTTISKKNTIKTMREPTIKFRTFTNAFCPCCLNQKQRDCANHIQVNLLNALKALGNLRRFHGISVPIKTCGCNGHRNMNYLRCATSLSNFLEAIHCPKTPYSYLSADSDASESIENQQNMNIKASAEKDEKFNECTIKKENRNAKRESAARQSKSIPLLNWGPLFCCYSKKCAYQNCNECGIKKFFHGSNLCNIERNADIEVIVRKYENVQGRSRGMQMEVVEVKMKGDQLMDHY